MNMTSLDNIFNTFIVGACIDSFFRFRVTPSIGVWVHELLVGEEVDKELFSVHQVTFTC